MNKGEFIKAIATEANLTGAQANAAYNAFVDVIVKTLKEDDKVQLVGFGTFELKHKDARECFNPSTGTKIEIDQTDVPVFKMGKAFKDVFKK